MKAGKTTIIKPQKIKEKENKNYELIGAIVLLIVGIILATNSSKAVVIVCYCIGTIISLFGGYHLLNYYRLKKELNIENNTNLIIGISTIFVGIVILILASAIETFLRFIIGIILIVNGIKKIKFSIAFQNYIILTTGIIFVAMGLYTILAENIIFTLVGIILIISSIMDMIKFFKEQKK